MAREKARGPARVSVTTAAVGARARGGALRECLCPPLPRCRQPPGPGGELGAALPVLRPCGLLGPEGLGVPPGTCSLPQARAGPDHRGQIGSVAPANASLRKCVCVRVREETSFGSSRKSSCDSSCHCPLLKVQYAAPGPIAGGGDSCNPPPWPSPGSRSAFRPGGQEGGFVVKAPASLVLTEVWGPLQLPSSEGSAFPRRWVAGGHVTCTQALRSPPSAPGAS